ncbi:butyrophilin-like protein 2 isoform X3 [Micropterus salmoides]|uniref:butyrophilin-like protein 2 isoform X3 n=1 Tax=Micropterus salmoides TaxID=27706 RepID=UPI0018EA7AA2|nr:butyrophilin-like protein 2 isoform X3 [Micropterus salmoides]
MFVSSGEPPAMYQTQLIKAAEGGDVTLQCRLDPPVNLSAFTVDWTRLDNKDIVHVYRHQQDDPDPQTDQYRSRTTLLHEDLIRGVLTLHISSVKLSDRGLYKGFVPKLKTSCVVDLIVEMVGKDQQNETKRDYSSTTGPPEEEETEPDGREKSMTRLRGQGEQKSEAANGCELKHLRTSSTNSDPDAGNLNNVQVVK